MALTEAQKALLDKVKPEHREGFMRMMKERLTALETARNKLREQANQTDDSKEN